MGLPSSVPHNMEKIKTLINKPAASATLQRALTLPSQTHLPGFFRSPLPHGMIFTSLLASPFHILVHIMCFFFCLVSFVWDIVCYFHDGSVGFLVNGGLYLFSSSFGIFILSSPYSLKTCWSEGTLVLLFFYVELKF